MDEQTNNPAEPTPTNPAPAEPTPAEPTLMGNASNPQETTQETYTPVDWAKINVPQDFGEVGDDFKTLIGDLKLSQDGAQKALDFYNSQVQAEAAKVKETVDGWQKESISKFGDEGIEVAKKAYNAFATPELKQLFESTGLANNPAVIAMFNTIGKKITEGSLVLGDGAEPKKTPGQILFGKSLGLK